jgi:hypothetical protein
MPWVLDGNNLAGGGDRDTIRQAALALARRERLRIVLFFDGEPPAGAPSVERLGAVEVRYVPNADEAIVVFLRAQAPGWRLASDDRGLARRARDAGADVVGAANFWERAQRQEALAGRSAAAPDLACEAAYFHDPDNRLPEPPAHTIRRRRRR